MATSEAGLAREIERLITPTIEDLGFSIVRVQLSGQQQMRLQVMIERQDNEPMLVDDCAVASRAISATLDVEDPIRHSYELEVSSPGIDRPLTRPQDFEAYAGFEAKVEINLPIQGRKRFRGKLLGIDSGDIRIKVDNDEWRLPFDNLGRAKLIITDELLAAAGEEYKS